MPPESMTSTPPQAKGPAPEEIYGVMQKTLLTHNVLEQGLDTLVDSVHGDRYLDLLTHTPLCDKLAALSHLARAGRTRHQTIMLQMQRLEAVLEARQRMQRHLRPFLLVGRCLDWPGKRMSQLATRPDFASESGFLHWLAHPVVLPYPHAFHGEVMAGSMLFFVGERAAFLNGPQYGEMLEAIMPMADGALLVKRSVSPSCANSTTIDDNLVNNSPFCEVGLHEVTAKLSAVDLHRQVAQENTRTVRTLLAMPAMAWMEGCVPICALNEKGQTPLSVALGTADVEMTKLLLSANAAEGRRTQRMATDGFVVVAVGPNGVSLTVVLPAMATVLQLQTALLAHMRSNGYGQAYCEEDLRLVYGPPHNPVLLSNMPQARLHDVGFITHVTTLNLMISMAPRIVLSSFDATVTVWAPYGDHPYHRISNHDANGIVLSPNGRCLVMTVAEDCAEVLDLTTTTCKVQAHINLNGGAITTLMMNATGTLLGASSEDGTVSMFDLSILDANATETEAWPGTGDPPVPELEPVQRLAPLDPRGFGMTIAAMSPCGRWVAASARDKRALLWDLQTPGAPPLPFLEELDKITCMSFSYHDTDYPILAVALRDGTVRLFGVATRAEVGRCVGHRGVVHGVAFGPTGDLLTGSRDGTAKLWRGIECVMTFTGHTASVNAVAMSPNGRFFMTGSEDSTAKLWCTQTHQCLNTFRGHIAGLSAVTFSCGG